LCRAGMSKYISSRPIVCSWVKFLVECANYPLLRHVFNSYNSVILVVGVNRSETRRFWLQVHGTMMELDLEDNCIGPEGAVYIAEALQDNTNITRLVSDTYSRDTPKPAVLGKRTENPKNSPPTNLHAEFLVRLILAVIIKSMMEFYVGKYLTKLSFFVGEERH